MNQHPRASGSLRSQPSATGGPVTNGSATVHRMVELYEGGMGLQEIGLLVNRNPSTVYRALRSQDVKFRSGDARNSEGLSSMQLTILRLIETYVDDNGFPPSVRELSRLSGLTSTSTINHHISRLIEVGRLRRIPGVTRGLVVIRNVSVDGES